MTKIDKITTLGLDPQEVARYFVCSAGSLILTPLKLQKLVYYAYARCLSHSGIRLFDERIEAWQNGPVIPSLYHALKEFGASPVPIEWGKCDSFRSRKWHDSIDSIKDDIKMVNDKYGHLSAFDLVTLTHSEKAWEKARAGLSPDAPSTRYIEDEDILSGDSY